MFAPCMLLKILGIIIPQWIRGRIVELKLNDIVSESCNHCIQKQKDSLLPSGACWIDIYTQPEEFDCEDQLLKTPDGFDIDQLIAKYDHSDLLQFGTDEQISLFQEIYKSIGAPILRARDGWTVFSNMVNYYSEFLQPQGGEIGIE